MWLLLRMSGRSHAVHLSKLRLTQPGMLWLEHRLSLSSALRRKKQLTGLKSAVHPAPRPLASALLLPSHASSASPARVTIRTITHTPVAFSSSSSSAASSSSPTPEDSQAEAGKQQTPTTVPLDDVKRILRLAHPERWTLAGKQVALHDLFSMATRPLRPQPSKKNKTYL